MSEYSMYLLKSGFNGAYLGSYSSEAVQRFLDSINGVEAAEEDFIFEILQDIPTAANPAYLKSRPKSDREKIRATYNGPFSALKVAPLPTHFTIGPKRNQEVVLSKLTFKEASKVSLEVAAMNLAVFIPTTRKRMPLFFIERLRENREITDRDLEEYAQLSKDDPKKKGANPKTIAGILAAQLLRGNTKMVKTKVPASLGIGEVALEDPSLREAPVSGSVGLQFLPNTMLFRDSLETGQRGLLQIVKSLKDTKKKKPEEALCLELTIEALSGVQRAKQNGCAFASKGCRMVCLADAGQRYATNSDFFGRKTNELDERTGRLLLGFTQAAFIANPLCFLRVLIEACLQHAITHELEAHRYLIEDSYKNPTASPEFDVPKYIQKIPPAVRLNVFSDYPWELIYPDLFKLFDGKTRFPGENVYPFIQFYDYTKIPGRVPTRARAAIEAYFLDELTFEKKPYKLPPNYHITFSYSGSALSKEYSDIASELGQNTTFVFFTQELGNTVLNTIFPEAQASGSQKRPQLLKVLREIRKLFSGKARDAKGALLPSHFEGVPVINGDNYDLRYLDKEFGEGPFVIGLNWKSPQAVKIKLPDSAKSKTLDPVRAASPLTEWYEKTEVTENLDLSEGSSFAVVRYGLSTDFASGDGDFRIYFVRRGAPTAEKIRETMKAFEDFTFATETGNAINSTDDARTIQDQIFAFLEALNIEIDEG